MASNVVTERRGDLGRLTLSRFSMSSRDEARHGMTKGETRRETITGGREGTRRRRCMR